MKLNKAQLKLNELKKEEREIRKRRLQIIRRQLIKCVECGKNNQLHKWIFIQGHYQEFPDSCMSGDRWHECDTNFSDIICPKCKKENYIYNHPQKGKIVNLIDVQASEISLDKIFKVVGDRYDGSSGFDEETIFRS